jgi:hypothetical protein
VLAEELLDPSTANMSIVFSLQRSEARVANDRPSFRTTEYSCSFCISHLILPFYKGILIVSLNLCDRSVKFGSRQRHKNADKSPSMLDILRLYKSCISSVRRSMNLDAISTLIDIRF